MIARCAPDQGTAHIVKIRRQRVRQHQAFSDERVVRVIAELAHRLKRRVTIHARGSEDRRRGDQGRRTIGSCKASNDPTRSLSAWRLRHPALPHAHSAANTAEFGDRVGASPRRVYHYAPPLERLGPCSAGAQGRRAVHGGTDSGFSLTPYGHWHASEPRAAGRLVGLTPLERSAAHQHRAQALSAAS